eukprot:gnl/TRDRNA2_/TRDRNA2_132083_c0_seq1.p1 gnl/TRDRNA2_/TRDRNA2_132083_c0~~gnl/TRDRNA2_/TRDRNA2_132083_c0_seq1.p1  ORF type:complete len:917 (-),score=257.29 gnl/TRDRNA2_/TRDRNA2_132083_c0_seq1:75-2444(-)
MRAALEQAIDSPGEGAEASGLSRQALLHLMRLEAYAARNAEATLAAGKRLLQTWGCYYNVWSAYIAAVRYCVETNAYSTIRDLYKSAMAQVADYPSQIQTDYIQFERECGTLKSWRDARDQLSQQGVSDSTSVQEGTAPADKQQANSKPSKRPREDQHHERDNADVPASKVPNKGKSAGKSKGKGSGKKAKSGDGAVGKSAEKTSGQALETGEKPAAIAAPVVAKAQAVGTQKTGASAEKKAAEDAAPEKTEKASVSQSPAPTAQEVTVAAPPAPSSNDTVAAGPPASAANGVGAVVAAADAGGEGSESADTKDANAADKQDSSTHNPHIGNHFHQKQAAANPGKALLKADAEGQHTVYVSNLDWSVDEPQLYKLFGEVEGLREVRLVKDFQQRSKGYAYIDFEKPEQVQEAVLKRNDFVLNKRVMKVAPSLPTKPLFEEKTLFVTNLASGVTEDELKSAMSAKGEVVDVRIPLDQATKKSKGHAFVDFATAEAMEAGLSLDGSVIGGQEVKVSRSIPMKDHRHQTAAPRKDLPQRVNQKAILDGRREREDPVLQAQKWPTTLFVKNLAFQVDEEKLKNHFSQCGEVQRVQLCKNANGKSRGFGFVEFARAEDAQTALMLSESELCGREVVVSRSQRGITQKKPADMDVAKAPEAVAGQKRTAETADVDGPAEAQEQPEAKRQKVDDKDGGNEEKSKKKGKGKGKEKGKSKDEKGEKGEGKGKEGKGKEGKGKEGKGKKGKGKVAPAKRLELAEQAASDEAPEGDEKKAEAPQQNLSNADFRAMLLAGK